MATKKKNTVRDVKTILNDSKLQNYNTNFTISKKRNGGHRSNGGTRTPKAPKWFEDFVTQRFDPMAQRLGNLEDAVSTQFKAHGWTK